MTEATIDYSQDDLGSKILETNSYLYPDIDADGPIKREHRLYQRLIVDCLYASESQYGVITVIQLGFFGRKNVTN